MLQSLVLPINVNTCGAMNCTTNQRVLRELFMVILPIVYGRIAAANGLTLDVTIVNGVFTPADNTIRLFSLVLVV